MHLTNTFKNELTSSLKQYSLMNILQIANVLHFIHFMWLYTISIFSITGIFTKSKGLDEMAHNAIFHQGLHRLQ